MSVIAKAVSKNIVTSKAAEKGIWIVFFAYLTFAFSFVRVYTPVTPVPFTLQNLALFVSLYFLSSKHASLSQFLYISAGLIGLPVFAAGISGMLFLTGPTAGYLVGFVAAAFVMGKLMRLSGKIGFVKAALIFVAGDIIILTAGMLHLALVYKMGFTAAFAIGFAPFVAGDAIKIAAAASLFKFNRDK